MTTNGARALSGKTPTNGTGTVPLMTHPGTRARPQDPPLKGVQDPQDPEVNHLQAQALENQAQAQVPPQAPKPLAHLHRTSQLHVLTLGSSPIGPAPNADAHQLVEKISMFGRIRIQRMQNGVNALNNATSQTSTQAFQLL